MLKIKNNITTDYKNTTIFENIAFNNSETTFLKLNSNGSDTTFNEFDINNNVYEIFMITDIIMTAVELLILCIATCVWLRWRRNYRNQIFIQLTFTRFAKRIILYLLVLCEKYPCAQSVRIVVLNLHIYIDYVMLFLVLFFIKHMYDSLVIVFVKCSPINLMKVSLCTWLIPLPISMMCTAVIVTGLLEKWFVYLLICCIVRWPLILIGTYVYITIVYKVIIDKARQFMRGLTVITFLLCVTINLYLFSQDIIVLWCLKTTYAVLIGHILGLLVNSLILFLYSVLIIGNSKTNS